VLAKPDHGRAVVQDPSAVNLGLSCSADRLLKQSAFLPRTIGMERSSLAQACSHIFILQWMIVLLQPNFVILQSLASDVLH